MLRDVQIARTFYSIVVVAITTVASAGDWKQHTIDASSRGADGVRLGDLDRDGRIDIVTGWEEGGQIRVCFGPVSSEVRKKWDSITVGRVKSPEDAVPFDFDGDGWLDVVSCCEGATKNVFLHRNPGNAEDVRDASRWVTEPLEGAAGVTRWMFCEPLSKHLLVFGSKAPNGQISLCDVSGSQPRWMILRHSGWIMSLRSIDIDRDGRKDVLYSDRRTGTRQVGWLRQPARPHEKWTDHVIGGKQREVMFLDVSSFKEGQSKDALPIRIACQTKDGGVLLLTPHRGDVYAPWTQTEVARPADTGSGKAVAFADVNLDGRRDVVCTCEHSEQKVGVYALIRANDSWQFHDISGPTNGTKFDRIEIRDMDADGDVDVLTCEERENMGVIWYENPSR